jgi:hypothetical protein
MPVGSELRTRLGMRVFFSSLFVPIIRKADFHHATRAGNPFSFGTAQNRQRLRSSAIAPGSVDSKGIFHRLGAQGFKCFCHDTSFQSSEEQRIPISIKPYWQSKSTKQPGPKGARLFCDPTASLFSFLERQANMSKKSLSFLLTLRCRYNSNR